MCGISDIFWLAALALIPLFLWKEATVAPHLQTPLRWPTRAGFSAPRATPSRWMAGCILLASLCGATRLLSHPPLPCLAPSDLAYYNASEGSESVSDMVKLDGYVASFPLWKDGRLRLDIEATAIWLGDRAHPISGRVRFETGNRHPFRYGEQVRVIGQLTEPPVFDGFDFRAYLARKKIHSQMRFPRVQPLPGPLSGGAVKQFVYGLRARGESLLNRHLHEPYAGLANGMLLGIEAGIPDDLYDRFNLTGTSHVIVISGSNVALVTGVLLAVGIRLFGRRFALWPTLVGLAIYAILVGGDAAVMRAALMGGLFVYATVLGRQSTALVSLAAACCAMTLWNPLMFWDVGFQLSSAATLGLILFGPIFSERAESAWNAVSGWIRGQPSPGADRPHSLFMVPNSIKDLIRDSLLMTLAASATTLPLIVTYFERLSWISPITNLLIAPVQPLIMVGGGAGLIAGLLGLDLFANLLLLLPYVSLWWTVEMVNWNASLPGGSVEIAWFKGMHSAVTYALVFGLYWRKALAGIPGWLRSNILTRLTMRRQRSSAGSKLAKFLVSAPSWVLGVLAVASFLLWRVALTQPDGQLHVFFLDIGQGDGIFIQTPSGRQLLIDGGDDSRHLFAELGEVMPFWDRHIDAVIVTHPDWDHIGAQIAVPGRYTVGQAYTSGNALLHKDSQEWLGVVDTEEAPVISLQRGAWLDLGDGAVLWALWPPPEETLRGLDEDDKNERSLVFKLVYGDLSMMLTGDAGLPSEQFLLRTGQSIAAQVLKVGHHGSSSSSSRAFIEAVGPSVAVIQVGAENNFGHPSDEVLEILDGRLVLRNDKDGRVHIRSDGRHMWIEAESGEIDLLNDQADIGHGRPLARDANPAETSPIRLPDHSTTQLILGRR